MAQNAKLWANSGANWNFVVTPTPARARQSSCVIFLVARSCSTILVAARIERHTAEQSDHRHHAHSLSFLRPISVGFIRVPETRLR
jgi:hypothetical protein